MQNDEKQEGALDNTQVSESQDTTAEAVEKAEKDWKSEAMKFQRLLKKEQSKNLNKGTEEDESEVVESKPKKDTDSNIEERVELRLQGYSPDEVTDIVAIAKAKKVSLLEASKLPLVAKGIEAIRAEKKSTSQSPAPSNRVAVYKGKTYKEVLSDPNSTAADKQAAYEAMTGRRALNQSV